MATYSEPSSEQCRTIFTSEETEILTKAYEDGMKSTGAMHSAQLAEINTRINKPISVIRLGLYALQKLHLFFIVNMKYDSGLTVAS